MPVINQKNRVAQLFKIDPDRLASEHLTLRSPFQMRKRAVEAKLIIGNNQPGNLDPVLVGNIAKAHYYYRVLKSGKTFDEIAAEENLSKRRILQIIDLAFLAPSITR